MRHKDALAANPNPNPDLWKVHYGAATLEAKEYPLGDGGDCSGADGHLELQKRPGKFQEPLTGWQVRRMGRVQPWQQ